ncbi:hypothetical protein A3C23_02655 [Candidatus Roizmanbacteria bacterium RIFCSPHIGHO2_02_FULL_37_13b]|uniref:DUF1902 domain-containing protein n=1 Tax=Candidatus Roizmanbacteria bacterium RIFCSPLOWO2_02_FULL_36_11 TaxID=1802071 RepID=A0A1F7JG44_9BACT|nr:MAG: hypothetical protein A3C23_02655 [Candidatus Roizmanbacteria bacterium RIFCSPHIGHO2_02_FULL_37_13b]OGK54574.1 MAG: hypothetical protein A3H78_01665 [Candidatus Roizmanbacteria bacterium RIFCSPLOWO2_02_FULL_36_11]
MKIAQFPYLPKTIKVNIMRHKDGSGYFAKLSEYDVFTEADTELELEEMINDLIYDLFEVPKEYQGKIRYLKENKDKEFENIKRLLIYSTPDSIGKYLFS